MSYANLIFKRIPFAALISDRGDWSSPLGWEKKIFGWIAVRRAIPAEKGEHIRMPYSAAKIVSISPGAMPPFTLETHTINAKLNLPILPKGVFWRVRSSVSNVAILCQKTSIHLLTRRRAGRVGFMIVDNLVISQLFWSLVHIVADLLRRTRACLIEAPPNLSTDKSTCLIIFLQFSADLCDSRAPGMVKRGPRHLKFPQMNR